MALTEKSEIDKIEIVGWNIQVRQAITIERDGQFVSKTYHRWVLHPDDDILSQEEKVQAIARATWTPEVIAAYEAQQAANQNNLG
jgi:hypothetical protein